MAFGFAYDDYPVIVQNPALHGAGWRELLSARWFDSLYRPASMGSLAMDWALGQGGPTLFHVENLVLHVLVTVGVFALAYPAFGAWGAFAAGLLFAVHPVHVEAVASIVGRAELLAALGLVACALCYRADTSLAGQPFRWRRAFAWTGTLVAALLGMASKETAFVLPALLLAVDWMDAKAAGASPVARVRSHAGLWLAVIGVWACWLAVWLAHVDLVAARPVSGGLATLSLPLRAVAMLGIVPQYARLLMIPVHLSADYSPRFLEASASLSAATVAGLATLGACGALAYAARRRLPGVTAGLAWTAIALVPVCNVIAPSEILLAERNMYIPSIGIALALGAIVAGLSVTRLKLALGALALLATLGAVRSVIRIPVWRDNASLLSSIVRDAPGSFRADWIAAQDAFDAGRREDGQALLSRALAASPREPGLLLYYATRLEQDSDWAGAGRALAAAYRAKPLTTRYAAMAIDALVHGGAWDTAAAVLREAWHDSTSIPLRVARANLAIARGQLAEAVALRRGVAREVGGAWQYWLLTAEAAEAGRDCEALDEALRFLEALNPALPEFAALTTRRPMVHCTPR
ncbi:MAG TPA: hypothetical protein VGI83_00530 [Gemmatimonadales bacterium]